MVILSQHHAQESKERTGVSALAEMRAAVARPKADVPTTNAVLPLCSWRSADVHCLACHTYKWSAKNARVSNSTSKF